LLFEKLKKERKIRKMNIRKKEENRNETEITYQEAKIGKTLQLWEKGYESRCNGDKKTVEISYCF